MFVGIARLGWLAAFVTCLWSVESYAMTLRSAVGYCVLVPASCQYSSAQLTWSQGQSRRRVPVDAAYMDWAMPTIQRRITQAGVRLAHYLNLALDPAYRGL